MYTSGSTGTPKGVVIPHRAVVRVACVTDYVQLSPADTVAHLSNPAFDAATFEIWGSLLNGSRIAVIPREAVLSLREPLPLRTLAEAHDALGRPDSLLSNAQFDAALDTFMALWSRGYAGNTSVIVKATSSTGRLAPALLQPNVGSRAIYLNLGTEPYLATLLAGQNSPIDLRGHGPSGSGGCNRWSRKRSGRCTRCRSASWRR